jgi:hypothetical protein
MQSQRSEHGDKRKHKKGRLGLRQEQHPSKDISQAEGGTSEETEKEELREDTQMERLGYR